MAQINITQTGTSGIATPESGVVAIFANNADNGKLYYKFDDGSIAPVDTGGTGGGAAGSSGTSGTGISGSSGTSGVGSSGTSGTGGSGSSGTSGTGVSGSSGTSGDPGSSGTSGTTGTSGNGTDGSSGTSGADGSSGTSGETGASGSSGTSGTNAPGITSGSSGTSGDSGSSGTSGNNGSSGTSGNNGSSGTSGVDGDRYKTTSTSSFTLGASGTITVGTGLAYTPAQSITVVYDVNNFQECEVITYNSGNGALQFGTPTRTVGSGTYTSWTVNLDGASGGDGSSGTSGANGSSGTSGANGSSGTSGSGSSGTSGSGSSGTSGEAGAPGSSGTSGTSAPGITSGSSGTSGAAGAPGDPGSSGTSGVGTPGSSGTSGTGGGGGAALTVRDGSTAVGDVEFLTFSGGTVSSGTSGVAQVTITGGGGGVSTVYNGVVRAYVDHGSNRTSEILSAGTVYGGLTWGRSSTTLTITSTSHGLTTGDYIVIRNMSEDYSLVSVTVTDTDTLTCTVADSGGTSGNEGAYIPVPIVDTGSTVSDDEMTITSPSVGTVQIISIRITTGTKSGTTFTLKMPQSLSNGAGANNSLITMNPPTVGVYKLSDGAFVNTSYVANLNTSSNFNHFTVGAIPTLVNIAIKFNF